MPLFQDADCEQYSNIWIVPARANSHTSGAKMHARAQRDVCKRLKMSDYLVWHQVCKGLGSTEPAKGKHLTPGLFLSTEP